MTRKQAMTNVGGRVRFFSLPATPHDKTGTVEKLFMGETEWIARISWDDGRVSNHMIDHLELLRT